MKRSRIGKVLGTWFLTAAWSASCPQEQNSVTAYYSGETEQYTLSAIMKDGVDYLSIDELSDWLGISRYTNAQNRKTLYRSGNRTLKLTASNPFFAIDDLLYQMPLPPLEVGGKTYVPLILFLETAKPFFSVRFFYDHERRLLRVSKVRENIVGIEFFDKGNGTVIKLITTKSFKPSDVSAALANGWLHVTCFGGFLDSAYIASIPAGRSFREIRPYQMDQSAQISFKLQQDMSDKKIDVVDNAVFISLWSPLRNGSVPSALALDREKWRIDCIVIDPGHGGADPGALGPSKLKEKEITMDVALRLRTLLKNALRGVTVLLTRENDQFMGLKERTQFANANRGKLFISIHIDANPSRSVRGFSTYFLGVSRTPEALEAAQKENSVVQMEASSEIYSEFQDASYILNAIAQSSYRNESRDLAQMVNQSLRKSIGIPDLGVHQAGFWVLVGAAMPCILVESGFLSNPYEERLLRTRSFRQNIAEGMCESVVQFKKRYEMGIE